MKRGPVWLFSRNVDLAVFLGSAVVSFGALGVGALTGILHDETPGWAWIPAVILCGAAVLAWTAAKMMLGEPLLAGFFGGEPALRLGVYAVVIGGVVLPALWRRARAGQRRTGAAVALLLAWLVTFALLERALGWDDASPEEWRWWHEGIDLAMWIGWIPIAIALLRRRDRPLEVAAPVA